MVGRAVDDSPQLPVTNSIDTAQVPGGPCNATYLSVIQGEAI
jgi:hypothetical protein